MLAKHPARARSAPLLESERAGRRSIAAAESYGEAARVLGTLAERGFPVERLVIVAPGMRYVEHDGGRLNAGARVLGAASWAAVVGALTGSILDLFEVVDPRVSGPGLAVWGAGIGAVVGVIGTIVLRLVGVPAGEAGTGRILASRFEVVGDHVMAERAGRLLDASPGP